MLSRPTLTLFAFVLGIVSLSTRLLADINGTASILDGDTIAIHGQSIRLHGVDAPESRQTCTAEGKAWPCGRRAAFALSNKIGRRHVTCRERGRDRYDRVVAVCFVGDVELNRWLVREGWALAYRQYSSDYIDEETAASVARGGRLARPIRGALVSVRRSTPPSRDTQ